MADPAPFITLDLEISDSTLEGLQALESRFDLPLKDIIRLILAQAPRSRSVTDLLAYVRFGRKLSELESAQAIFENVRPKGGVQVHGFSEYAGKVDVRTKCGALIRRFDLIWTGKAITCPICKDK